MLRGDSLQIKIYHSLYQALLKAVKVIIEAKRNLFIAGQHTSYAKALEKTIRNKKGDRENITQ